MNHLKTSSEPFFQQTTPFVRKFPNAHLKQVQYFHAVQLTVAQHDQDFASEKLQRQTLQLFVFQLLKCILFLQNVLANQNTSQNLIFTDLIKILLKT